MANPQLPPEPALRAIADDVIGLCKLSFVAAAADKGPTTNGMLDQACRNFIASRPPATRKQYALRANALLDAPSDLRSAQFGRYAAVGPDEFRSLGADGLVQKLGPPRVQAAQLRTDVDAMRTRLVRVATASTTNGHAQDFFRIDSGALQEAFAAARQREIAKRLSPELGPMVKDAQDGLAFTKLRLFIRKVRCVEETSGVLEGSDEINMGGVAADPFGNSWIVGKGEFEVSDDFDEGESVYWGMTKKLTGWNLVTDPHAFPYVYSVVISLGEKDDGGFYDWLKGLWDAVKEKVTALAGGLAGAAIGGALAGAWGAVIGAIVGFLIGWIVSLFDNPDDIVGTVPLVLSLGSYTKSYYDWAGLTAPNGLGSLLVFHDDGHYRVATAHKVFTQ